jgi:hypothetical protein
MSEHVERGGRKLDLKIRALANKLGVMLDSSTDGLTEGDTLIGKKQAIGP